MVKFSHRLLSALRLSPVLLLTLSLYLRSWGQVSAFPRNPAAPLGQEYLFLPHDDADPDFYEFNNHRVKRSEDEQLPGNLAVTTQPPEPIEHRTASVRGIRVEEVSKGVNYENRGTSVILADTSAVIRLFGDRFKKDTIIRFVMESGSRGSDCDDLTSTKSFQLYRTDMTNYAALAKVQLPPLDEGEGQFYLCVKDNNTDMPWVHQGTENWMQLRTYEKMFPLWSLIVCIIVLLILSGLFSGLNLGLMALDRTEMKIVAATGTDKERRYAKTIQPLRDNGNYLLCSLLLGNVMVNSTLTIILDEISSGLIAVIGATLSIVIFGEIIPQALCSRHGLAVGARTVWLTKFFMAITFPLSYPISVLLDKVLGEEIGNVYNRDRLKELIRVTHDYNDLEKDEVNIIAGALELKQKPVSDVMTKLDRVFMLPVDAVLDFDTVSEIMSQGYSRVPIYEGSRSNLISLLYTKDLAFVDPDDKMPLKSICEFYSNPIMYVFETTTLDVIFRDFKTGNKGHMAFVHRVNEGEKDSDPYYEVVGLLTMEDVIEALIQAEINDETDVYDSMRRRRSKANLGSPSTSRLSRWKCDDIHVSPQLILAAFQYLSTSVDEFHNESISKTILQRLLNQNLFFQIKVKNRDNSRNGNTMTIYEKGKAADYFVLVLEGRVQVEMGNENLVFESGPFSFFGVHILQKPPEGEVAPPTTPPAIAGSPARKFSVGANYESVLYSHFVPDYSVRPVQDTTFLKISRSMYLAAKQATLLEKALSTGDPTAQNEVGDNFEKQIDRMTSSAGNNHFARRSGSVKLHHGIRTVDGHHHPATATRKSSNEVFSEIVLTPSHLINGYDKDPMEPVKGPPSRKVSEGPPSRKISEGPEKNVKFQDLPNDESISPPHSNRKIGTSIGPTLDINEENNENSKDDPNNPNEKL